MRLAYILPRYGSEVLGGAERLAQGAIERLAQRGHDIEVWTTCARDTYTWINEHPVGLEQVNGIRVRRFPVQPHQPYDIFAELLTPESQYKWVSHLAHSPQLYRYIEAHGPAFDFLVFIPYIVGMTYCGARIHPQRSIVWACLHNELAAYLAPTRRVLANAAGIIFNTVAEQALMVNKLGIKHPRTVVTGMGFDLPAGDGTTFRQKYPQIGRQFFIYAGRLEPDKNVDLLFQYFSRYRSRHNHPLDLVLLGNGPLNNGKKIPGIIPLGFVDEVTKRNALAAATFLCQPSSNESFSIVLMESWTQGRPVLVHERCAVTIEHVRQAQGGLYFANYNDFEGAVEYLLTQPDQADQMGANGRAYVRQNYNWPVIIDRLEQALLRWLEES